MDNSTLTYRKYLFKIAYNMTGDIQKAEDLVQDTYLKWLQTDKADIKNEKAYLTRMLTNNAIDLLNQLKKEREVYKGLWMPEPIITREENLEDEHNLEYAILFLLERLNPLERAVYVFKESFSITHEEIAEILDTSVENSRQLLHRAKEKIRSPKKKTKADTEKKQALMTAYLQAIYEKNFDGLKSLFKEDIILYSDGGGKMAAALKPISTYNKVVKFLKGVMELDPTAEFAVEPVYLNGYEGILVYRNGHLDTVLQIECEEDKISELYFLRNPDKIHI